jgi:hypothetical protein
MNKKELDNLIKTCNKLEPMMDKAKVLKGISVCDTYKIEITPKSVIAGYMSFYL